MVENVIARVKGVFGIRIEINESKYVLTEISYGVIYCKSAK